MSLLLMTHAHPKRTSAWEGADALRPLAPEGQEQARALALHWARTPLERVISAPILRCLETVEPLASARDLPLEADARLLDRDGTGDPRGALALISSCGEQPIALCAASATIQRLLRAFADGGVPLEQPLRAEEASVWSLEGLGGKAPRARYIPPPDLPAASRPRVAVLELGSTSLHLVLHELLPDGRLDRVDHRRAMLRPDGLIAGTGAPQHEVEKRAVDAVRELRAFALENGAERILAVGRPDLGDSEAGRDLAERLSAALGEPVRILSLEEHVLSLFRAIRERLSLGVLRALAFDLGGANLELAIGDEREVPVVRSLPLGVVRLREAFVRNDPPLESEVRELREHVWSVLSPHLQEISRARPSRCVGSGGTISALARMVPGNPAQERGLFIARGALELLEATLCERGFEDRLRLPGIDPRRAELLPTAAVTLGTIADALGLVGFAVSDWGVSEGIALGAFS